jgi:hypothetical protein
LVTCIELKIQQAMVFTLPWISAHLMPSMHTNLVRLPLQHCQHHHLT